MNSRGGDASSYLLALRARSRLPPFRARLPRLGHANGVLLFLCLLERRHQHYALHCLFLSVTERRIRVKATYKGEKLELKFEEGSSVEDMLHSLHLYIDAHIVTILNHPVPSTHVLRDGEELKIIQVASGG